jgi:hypothetical protein
MNNIYNGLRECQRVVIFPDADWRCGANGPKFEDSGGNEKMRINPRVRHTMLLDCRKSLPGPKAPTISQVMYSTILYGTCAV